MKGNLIVAGITTTLAVIFILKESFEADKRRWMFAAHKFQYPSYLNGTGHCYHSVNEEDLKDYLNKSDFYHRLYNENLALEWPRTNMFGQIYHDVMGAINKTKWPHNPDIDQFMEQREHWRRNSSQSGTTTSGQTCLNCAINSACYNSTANLWHPSKVFCLLLFTLLTTSGYCQRDVIKLIHFILIGWLALCHHSSHYFYKALITESKGVCVLWDSEN